ncbi:MFS general substrate transporter [Glarea lozoyensis ATCC 20868]|uniref:MFS general substrate transporter n=1 Tax=Glarea lozoyensis (strain ATCC 20868 / MF5171) TaxID=1116229 RepID=S3DFD3_GLAL2|nr:MFS general substrate transporter [Glarea lozoyensis ATCC 20868]EPE35794.1 MFS general substrate transporter [Glarea lozoyensis ATCC 20868]
MSAPLTEEKVAHDKSPDSGSNTPSFSDESIDNPTGISEKALLRKLDYKLLPGLTLLYLLSFLDRSNIGNARLEGLTDDLHITGNQYLFTLTVYFIGYVLFEIPCNIVLKRTTPKLWLPTLMLAWGVVATLMGLCHNLGGFIAARFFLGVTESGLFPGVVFYLSMWYKRTETHYRVALFFSAASLAGAFGGILAFGIGKMKGVAGLAGWRWIFILEGILTVIVALTAYLFIHNYPSTAPFLTEPERTLIHARLAHDTDATNDEKFAWSNVRAALADYKCWMYGFGFHTMSLPLYTLSLFLPTIIKELGYKAAEAQLLTVPPYAVATILTLLVAVASEKTKKRAPFILASTSLAIIGYIILLTAPRSKPGVSYVGTIFAAAGIYPSTAIVLSWPAANVSGQSKRATATAMTITIGNLGAVLGTQLYRPKTSPRWYLGHGFALGYLVFNLINTAALWGLLERENRGKRVRIEQGERSEGGIVSDEDVRFLFQT